MLGYEKVIVFSKKVNFQYVTRGRYTVSNRNRDLYFVNCFVLELGTGNLERKVSVFYSSPSYTVFSSATNLVHQSLLPKISLRTSSTSLFDLPLDPFRIDSVVPVVVSRLRDFFILVPPVQTPDRPPDILVPYLSFSLQCCLSFISRHI